MTLDIAIDVNVTSTPSIILALLPSGYYPLIASLGILPHIAALGLLPHFPSRKLTTATTSPLSLNQLLPSGYSITALGLLHYCPRVIAPLPSGYYISALGLSCAFPQPLGYSITALGLSKAFPQNITFCCR